MEKNNKKIINAWAMYDWANSVYSLVITATIFPVYYNAVTTSESGSDLVNFFGIQITNTVLYSYSLSASFLIIAGLAPLLSGIADYGGKRKSFMQFFTYLGAISCMALFFFEGQWVEYGIIFSVLASIGFAGSLVFYNSYLPVIATPDKFDMVSAKGFSMGYIGSVILLVVSLVLVMNPGAIGFANESSATRFTFLLVGVWWIGFAQLSFRRLPKNKGQQADKLLKRGYLELQKVFKGIKSQVNLKRFLAAFFLYNTGVQTVIYLAASFGDKALNMSGDKLILTILIIQIVAIAGSYLFAYISKLQGNKLSLVIMILIWILICFLAYFIYTEYQFYGLAFLVGLVMGGIQSLSRATYSKLIPETTKDHTSYFSYYDVTEKVSIVIGTFSYGLVEQITGSMRNSTMALAIFFVAGLLVLLTARIPFSKNKIAALKQV